MAKLSSESIEKFASRKGALRVAVENFLGTLDGMTWGEATANLEYDARSYEWNAATVRAIQAGIDINFNGN